MDCLSAEEIFPVFSSGFFWRGKVGGSINERILGGRCVRLKESKRVNAVS